MMHLAPVLNCPAPSTANRPMRPQAATDMMVCGEDLGFVPGCVPPVMQVRFYCQMGAHYRVNRRGSRGHVGHMGHGRVCPPPVMQARFGVGVLWSWGLSTPIYLKP